MSEKAKPISSTSGVSATMMEIDCNDPVLKEQMRQMMGPQAIDQMIRLAISNCWMMLPDEKKSVDVLEAEIRRIVDRAIKDLREDAAAFGVKLKQ